MVSSDLATVEIVQLVQRYASADHLSLPIAVMVIFWSDDTICRKWSAGEWVIVEDGDGEGRGGWIGWSDDGEWRWWKALFPKVLLRSSTGQPCIANLSTAVTGLRRQNIGASPDMD